MRFRHVRCTEDYRAVLDFEVQRATPMYSENLYLVVEHILVLLHSVPPWPATGIARRIKQTRCRKMKLQADFKTSYHGDQG